MVGNRVRPQSWLVVCDLEPGLLGVGEAFFVCPSPSFSLLCRRSPEAGKVGMAGSPFAERTGPEHSRSHRPVPGETE